MSAAKKITLKARAASAEKIANKLLDLMGTSAKAVAQEDKEQDAILIEISTDTETGLLIGRHGETLEALQLIIGLGLHQKYGEWTRVLTNLGDWREKQSEKLSDLAKQAAERAKATGEDQNLYNLNASQRRVVHMEVSEDKDVETESVGEGAERYLVIRSKK